jgi:anti-anti-sigma factor
MSASPPIAIRRTSPAVAVVVLRGELDAYNAAAIRRELSAALAARSSVVLDLRAAEFVDSVVAGEILDARKTARQLGLGFAIVLSDSRANHVRRMLEQTNLIEIFDVFDTPEAAASALAQA